MLKHTNSRAWGCSLRVHRHSGNPNHAQLHVSTVIEGEEAERVIANAFNTVEKQILGGDAA